MSRGISIYYKLIQSEDEKLIYAYYGADLNKGYEEKYLLMYDGLIEIQVEALDKDNVIAVSKIFREYKHSVQR